MASQQQHTQASSTSQSSYRRQDKHQKVVTTPYGRGLVIRTRSEDGIYEIELLDWQTAAAAVGSKNKRAPIIYTSIRYPSVTPMVGDDVLCLYGRGRVLSISNDDDKCVVELMSWRLAQRCTVKCFLRLSDVSVVRKKTLYEMNAFEKVHYAQQVKQTATAHFAKKEYNNALADYDKAVHAVRFVQHDANSTNELRADLLVLMITCCNNAGTCCILLQEWQEAIKFGNNALVLLEALYEKRGMRVHSILNKDGISDAKLFGEWKCKSLLIKARGLLERADYDDSMEALKQAHVAIAMYMESDQLQDADFQAEYQTLHKQSVLVKRMRATCFQKRKAVKQKEKQRAQAMFGSPEQKKKSVKIASTAETTASENKKASAAEQPTALNMGDDRPPLIKKRSVSFSDDTKPGTDVMNEEEEKEEPWYEEHKEALILSGIVGLAALTTIFLRSRK